MKPPLAPPVPPWGTGRIAMPRFTFTGNSVVLVQLMRHYPNMGMPKQRRFAGNQERQSFLMFSTEQKMSN